MERALYIRIKETIVREEGPHMIGLVEPLERDINDLIRNKMVHIVIEFPGSYPAMIALLKFLGLRQPGDGEKVA